MNDKTIIKTISVVYSIIVSALLFIFLFLSSLFVTLQNGVYIDKFSSSTLKFDELYIKWNEKIDISLDNLIILKSDKSKSEFQTDNIIKLISKSATLINLLGSVNLKKIAFDDINASFNYNEVDGGLLSASSKDFQLNSSITVKMNKILFHIDTLKDLQRDISLNGDILIKNASIYSKVHLNIHQDIFATINALSTQKKLFYNIKSEKSIHSIAYTVKMLHLPRAIEYWILDAIDMKEATLKKAYGWLAYNNLKMALQNIYISADLNHLNYKYNKTLDAIHTVHTELEFKKGVLYIRPKEAYSYKQKLEDSVINIDFTQKEELLTIVLLFDGTLNKDILTILEAYKVKLPFLQKSGVTHTDLTLKINLRTIAVDAQGVFTTKKANFDYAGLNIDIFNAKIVLNNYNVTIKNMFAKYKDIAQTDVDVAFNAKTSTGTIDFDVKDISLTKLHLTNAKRALHVKYTISNKQDYIDIGKSQWHFFDEIVNIEKIKAPFNAKELLLKIPTTKMSLGKDISLFISGETNVSTLKSEYNIDLLSLEYNNFTLLNDKIDLKLKYNDALKISSLDDITLINNDIVYDLNNFVFDIKDENLKIDTDLTLKDILSTTLSLKYNTTTSKGDSTLKKTEISIQKKGDLLKIKKDIHFKIDKSENLLSVSSRDLNSKFLYNKDIWTLNIDSISSLYGYSKVFQKYKLSDGQIKINKNAKNDLININAVVKYPYKMLVIDNKPVERYSINGNFNTTTKETSLNVNNKLDVIVGDDINISLQNAGIDIFEIINSLEDNSTEKESTPAKIVNFRATDSFLYISQNRRILSDSIKLKYINNKIVSKLRHKDALALFILKDGKFNLKGTNFNDEFMSNLFSLSKFKNGKLDFSMKGKLKNYKGTFNLTNTTVTEYKLLNNILAFINTIPSLMTFSLPGYNKKGLEIKNAYLNFTSKDDIFNISDIYLDSKEMDILGRGTASYLYNTIDLKLNLKTDLASTISQIPVVGYILFDKDSISTSLKVSGKLDDPQVSSLLAQEIIVAPLNILKRTILAPIHLLTGDADKL
jgi:hypothetical protein